MIKGLPTFTLITFMLYASSCSRQASRPIDIAREVFKPGTSPDFIDKHSTGDYSGHPNGSDLPTDVNTSFLPLWQTDKKAVVAMTLSYNNGKATDKYLYFTKDSSHWKIYALATPTLARMHERMKLEMEALTPGQLDSIIGVYQHQEYAPYKSKEEFNFILNSLRLKLAPDDSLIAHFRRHEKTFNKLRTALPASLKSPETESPTLINTRTAEYSPLLISNVTTGGFLPAECIDFHILNDQVGYLYTPNKKYLPELHPDKVMMLRSLGDGWYLYKVAIYL